LWTRANNLFLFTALNSNGNEIIYDQPIPLNVFSHFYYEQRFNETTQKYVIKVLINDTIVKEIINNDVRDFQNVSVYLSDPWFSPANVIVKDFKYGIF